jgi:colicin import membrane protein
MGILEDKLKELEEFKAKLAADHKAQQEKIAEDEAARVREAELERKLRTEEYEKKVAAIEAKRKQEAEAVEAERRAIREKDAALELEKNKAEEATNKVQNQLDQIAQQMQQVSFMEEQNRKNIENAKAMADERVRREAEKDDLITSDYPTTQTDGGSAAPQTDGENHQQSMSQHLRSILRQHGRNY